MLTRLLLAPTLLLSTWHFAAAQQAPAAPAQDTIRDTRLAQRLDTDEEAPASQPLPAAVAPALPAAVVPATLTETTLSGTVLDATSRQPVQASIEVLDNATGQIISKLHCSPEGKYEVNLPAGTNYGLVVRDGAYPFHSENVTLPARVSSPETVRNFRLQKLEPGSNILLNNIFFYPGTANLLPESTAELARLVKLLDDKPKLKLKLCSHTDDTGSSATDLALSQRRAQILAAYLTEHKIKSDRLTINGYGASIPVSSTEDGHRNERVAFKVVAK